MDCFKCSMCVFLLKEISSLRDELFELSVSCETSQNLNPSCETQTIKNCIDATCQTELSQDFDIVSSQSSILQTEALPTNTAITGSVVEHTIDHTRNTPFDVIPGKPFADFDVVKLANDSDFARINSREVKYYGEYSYSYGKTTHKPCSIPKESYLATIIEKVKSVYPSQIFNSVLVTKFANGNSFLPLHSDNESVIVKNSQILTVSLGASRTVTFQCRKGGSVKSLQVNHGDVYIMSADSQANYRHGIPRDFGKCMRISITFRSVKPPSDNLNEACGNSSSDILSETKSKISVASPSHNPQSNSTNYVLEDNSEAQCIDTLFISSSMFRHLNEDKLSSDKHSSKVLFYPGATAGGILKRLQEDPSLQSIVSKDIKKIYLLCGTNNVDQILEVPRKLNDNVNIDQRQYNAQKYDTTLVEIEHLVNYLHECFQCASLNIINILPRTSYTRNWVINDLNLFLNNLCFKQGHNFVSTELNRYLFCNRQGFRRCELFHVTGSDNVHLNSAGVIKIGKLLKHLMHQ